MRRGSVLLPALVLAAVGVPVGASAGVVEDVPVATGYFYEGDGYALFTGPPFEQGCLGEGFPEATAMLVDPPADLEHFSARFESDMLLYDLDALGLDSAGELLDVACTAVAQGSDDVPTPIAAGTGRVSFRERCEYGIDGCGSPGSVLHAKDDTHGTVTTADGTTLRVRGRVVVDVFFTEDGVTEDIRALTLDVR